MQGAHGRVSSGRRGQPRACITGSQQSESGGALWGNAGWKHPREAGGSKDRPSLLPPVAPALTRHPCKAPRSQSTQRKFGHSSSTFKSSEALAESVAPGTFPRPLEPAPPTLPPGGCPHTQIPPHPHAQVSQEAPLKAEGNTHHDT